MQVFPITPLVLALLAFVAYRGPDKLFGLVILTLPFGMLAAFVLTGLGGLSLMATHLAVAALAGLLFLQAAFDLIRGKHVLIPREAILLGFFTVYAVVSATLLVRIFAGSFEVFPLSRGATGTQISIYFRSTLAPLTPGNSNLSQSAYIVLGFGFFVAAVIMIRRHGVEFAERWLRLAAAINIALGIIDFLGLDPFLSFIRTATYALANEQVIGGLSRTVGGFPEPSSFGGFSAVMFAYFAGVFAMRRRRIDGCIALGNLAFALMSLAATAIFAVAVVGLIGGICVLFQLGKSFPRSLMLGLALAMCALLAGLSLLLMLTDLAPFLERTITATVLDKADSESGLERGAWALYGLKAFVSTHGLGAGVGSLRSNGLVPAMLGSVGLPGMLAFIAFLGVAFLRPMGRYASQRMRSALFGARLAACAQLATMFLSLTVPDPGVVLLLLAAIAVGARMNSQQPSRSSHAMQPYRTFQASRPASASLDTA